MLGALEQRRPTLHGTGRRCSWPEEPGWYTEDDFLVDPRLGLAVVARGAGAIGGQGKPAGKLAVWSIAGEASSPAPWPGTSDTAEARVQRGLERARVAIERLSANWLAGLGKPIATAAALLLDGPTAILAHIGDCRVSRVRPDGLEALTREHTPGAMWPAESFPPDIARVTVRGLGIGGDPEIRRIVVQPGDTFLLTATDVESTLSRAELTSLLRPLAAPSGDIPSVVDALVRAIQQRQPGGGKATLAIVRVGHGDGGPPTRGSSRAPGLRWLFAAGEPLADPPSQWAAGTPGRGPDSQWFSEVFGGIMGGD